MIVLRAREKKKKNNGCMFLHLIVSLSMIMCTEIETTQNKFWIISFLITHHLEPRLCSVCSSFPLIAVVLRFGTMQNIMVTFHVSWTFQLNGLYIIALIRQTRWTLDKYYQLPFWILLVWSVGEVNFVLSLEFHKKRPMGQKACFR